MPLPEGRNISFIGFMGTGKTSVGKSLGRQTARPVVDVDHWIEKKTDRKIREIFDQDGEEHFRALEKEAIAEISQMTNTVITTGGGAVLDPANIDALKKNGWVIALSASVETIYERVKDSRHRPLLKGDTKNEILRLLEIRKPFYARADYYFKTDDLSPDQVAHLILETLEKERVS